MRPTSIIRFDRLYLGSIAFSVVSTAYSFEKTRSQLANDPSSVQLGLGTGFLVTTVAFSTGLMLLLWFLIARRASNVAKWILVALTALGLIMMITMFADLSVKNVPELALMFASTGLLLIALYYLFQRDAREWLASKGRVGAVDPTVFD